MKYRSRIERLFQTSSCSFYKTGRHDAYHVSSIHDDCLVFATLDLNVDRFDHQDISKRNERDIFNEASKIQRKGKPKQPVYNVAREGPG